MDAERLLADLDRCLHGRHQKDHCLGAGHAGGANTGNTLLETGERIGTGLHGDYAIVVPPPERRHIAAWWYVPLSAEEAGTPRYTLPDGYLAGTWTPTLGEDG